MHPEPFALVEKVRTAVLRYKIHAVGFFLSVILVVGLATIFGTRAYRSQAKLFMRLGRENVTVDPTATLGQAPLVAIPASRENEINSIIEMLRGRALLEKVVDKIGPAAVLGQVAISPSEADGHPGRATEAPAAAPSRVVDDRYRAVVYLAKHLEVEPVKKSNIIYISYEGQSPDLAQAVVVTLIDFYLDEHVRVNRTPGAQRFLAEQMTRMRAELTRSEETLRESQNQTGLISPDGQQQILVARIGRIEDELGQTEVAIAATSAELKSLKDRKSGLSPTHVTAIARGVPGTGLDNMRAQLYALQVKEEELLSKYSDRNPEVQLIRKQIAGAKDVLAQEAPREQVTTGPNKAYEEAEVAILKAEPLLASLRARAKALATQLSQERERLAAFTRNHERVGQLQREVDLLDSQYRRSVESLQRAQIDNALEAERISNISLAQPATFDVKPVRPSVLMNLAIGFTLALTGSIALALLLDWKASTAPRPMGAPDPGKWYEAPSGLSSSPDTISPASAAMAVAATPECTAAIMGQERGPNGSAG